MPRYMVIERFRAGDSLAVYQRFHDRGRMLPEGLHFIDSWLCADDRSCYQLMETENPDSFDAWVAQWADLVDFEIRELKDKPTRG